MQKEPAERFATINDFSQAFQQAVAGSGGLRATLTISWDEAHHGTQRTVTLPGGRKVPVTIQAGAQDGQELRLEGLGEPYYSGGPGGTLTLTLVVEQRKERPPVLETKNEEKQQERPPEAPSRRRWAAIAIGAAITAILLVSGLIIAPRLSTPQSSPIASLTIPQLKSSYNGSECSLTTGFCFFLEIFIDSQDQHGNIIARWIYEDTTYSCKGTVTRDKHITLTCTGGSQDYVLNVQGSIYPDGHLAGTNQAVSQIGTSESSWTAS